MLQDYIKFSGLFLKTINNDYSQLLLFIIAGLAFYIAYKEYILKCRPFVFPELVFDQKGGDWYFHFLLENAGEKPVLVKINKAELLIGDEIYPTQFNTEMLVSSGESKKLAPIGHINLNGRSKIINHEYRSNRVEIIFEVASKAVGDRKYKYLTEITYNIDVKGDVPVVQVVSEKFQ